MEKISLSVRKEFCEECSLALRRFVGKMEGVESIKVENGKIALEFASKKITGEKLSKITRESIDVIELRKGHLCVSVYECLLVNPADALKGAHVKSGAEVAPLSQRC